MSDMPVNPETPRGNLSGFVNYLGNDLLSGFLVFLIALPLCLAISIASGFPPIAGIFTAIIGGIVTTFISSSELTIKGPAAGLIVIAADCVKDFGGFDNPEAYKAALAVGVAAALLQICFGFFRAGILAEFFPSTVVHGMLAGIGAIIMVKQVPYLLGVDNAGKPLELLQEIPQMLWEANPAIVAIGMTSVLTMFLWPLIGSRVAALKKVPSPVVVLALTIPMGMVFDLLHEHSYVLQGHEYQLSEQYLVSMPDRPFGMFQEFATPAFAALMEWKAWRWVFLFFVIGTLESLLSAKAIDLLDPWHRKTDMNRDVLAVGVANLGAAMVGGLPMISEIVRSKANIDNGAKTRFADFWHGVFLLACVALIPMYLHWIPLAALAGMLIYTGFRLAHPSEFVHIFRIGKEQLAIFLVTMFIVFAEDLLLGVAAGIILKVIIHSYNGVPLRSMFKPFVEVREVNENTSIIIAKESAIFSNWIPFKRQIENIGLVQHRNLIVDLSDAQLVDHSVMGKLDEMSREFEQEGLSFEIRGLEDLLPLADSAQSARKRGLATMRRLTVTADQEIEAWLEENFVERGATGYTSMACNGAGRRELAGESVPVPKVRIEVVITPATSARIVQFLRDEVIGVYHVTACIESVDVVKRTSFLSEDEMRQSAAGSSH